MEQTMINVETLTSEILILKQQTAKNILEIGKKLNQVKASLPHGQFSRYLESKVDFTERTAQRYMKLYNEFSNTTALSDIDPSKLIALTELPEKDRENFIEINDIKNMSVREISKAIKETKKANKKSTLKNELSPIEPKETCTKKDKPITELEEAIKYDKELEEKLKNSKETIKKIKENLLINSKVDDASVRFEEVLFTDSLGIELKYNIFFIKYGSEQLITENYSAYWFEKLDITDSWDCLVRKVHKNDSLLNEEKDFILGECLKFKSDAKKRLNEIEKINSDNTRKEFKKAFEGFDLLQDALMGSQSSKDIYKKFYKVLAKTFHPDLGGSLEEMQEVNKLKEIWGI